MVAPISRWLSSDYLFSSIVQETFYDDFIKYKYSLQLRICVHVTVDWIPWSIIDKKDIALIAEQYWSKIKLQSRPRNETSRLSQHCFVSNRSSCFFGALFWGHSGHIAEHFQGLVPLWLKLAIVTRTVLEFSKSNIAAASWLLLVQANYWTAHLHNSSVLHIVIYWYYFFYYMFNG